MAASGTPWAASSSSPGRAASPRQPQTQPQRAQRPNRAVGPLLPPHPGPLLAISWTDSRLTLLLAVRRPAPFPPRTWYCRNLRSAYDARYGSVTAATPHHPARARGHGRRRGPPAGAGQTRRLPKLGTRPKAHRRPQGQSRKAVTPKRNNTQQPRPGTQT